MATKGVTEFVERLKGKKIGGSSGVFWVFNSDSVWVAIFKALTINEIKVGIGLFKIVKK